MTTLPEINDFGYPQNSEIDTLKTYITTESVVSATQAPEVSSRITAQATGATSWRRSGDDVKYKKNEAFVDVVEVVNWMGSAKGTTLRADVDGHIQMRAYLSGTPECKFGLNDKLVIDRGAVGTSMYSSSTVLVIIDKFLVQVVQALVWRIEASKDCT